MIEKLIPDECYLFCVNVIINIKLMLYHFKSVFTSTFNLCLIILVIWYAFQNFAKAMSFQIVYKIQNHFGETKIYKHGF